jgi:hypothetical protein
MDLLNEKQQDKSLKAEIEKIQEKQDEYSLVGTAYRRNGTILWSYSAMNNTLIEVVSEKKNYIQAVVVDGKLIAEHDAEIKAMIDTRCILFEAINRKSAEKRLSKYKAGKIQKLNNLRTSEGKMQIGAY